MTKITLNYFLSKTFDISIGIFYCNKVYFNTEKKKTLTWIEETSTTISLKKKHTTSQIYKQITLIIEWI